MPYTQSTFGAVTSQVSGILDDPTAKFWTVDEIHYAIWEFLRVFGAITAYWRERGVFNINGTTPWYDLSTQMPTLRTRDWTLDQLTQEIQYALLEPASGIAGTGMSGQVSITTILKAIQRARNRFVIDSKIPLTVHPAIPVAVPTDGLLQLPEETVYLHRLSFRDITSRSYANLWREDAWAADHNNQQWTQEQATPISFSQSELSPLTAQLVPAPINGGDIEAVTVDSLVIDTSDAAATFNVPDEYSHALKYAALADILSADSQLNDPLRAGYAEQRYRQSVDVAMTCKSVIRLTCNGVPLNLDTLNAIDAGMPFWRNQTGSPLVAGALFDLIGIAPACNREYSIAADVVRSAPLPVNDVDPIQIGPEDIDHLIDYVTHILLFKCGGNEFRATMTGYDSFLSAASGRNRILAVKARYMQPIFGQPAAEQQQRPDRMEIK